MPTPARGGHGGTTAGHTGDVTAPGPLGAFLQARRGGLTPQDVGLRTYGERRRVSGLRREEVAQLAGIGMSYYTRLEQGQSLHASAEVLDALASALRLDDAGRRHLHDLAATPRRPRPARPPAERVDDATEQLLDAVGDTPAVVLGAPQRRARVEPLGPRAAGRPAAARAGRRPGPGGRARVRRHRPGPAALRPGLPPGRPTRGDVRICVGSACIRSRRAERSPQAWLDQYVLARGRHVSRGTRVARP